MPQVRFHRFIKKVTRYDQVALLEAVALMASEQAQRHVQGPNDYFDGRDGVTPWALTEIAREAIVFGLPGGRVPRQDDVRRLCFHYANLTDPLGSSAASLEQFLVRLGFEQFRWQLSELEKLSRSRALFVEAAAQVPSATALSDAAWRASTGYSVGEIVDVGFFAEVWAARNRGVVELSILERPDLQRLFDALPREVITGVLRQLLSAPIGRLKGMDSTASVSKEVMEHRFNPLTARPLVRLTKERLIAPHPLLLFHRVSPTGLYYDRCRDPGFTDQLGAVLEHYVGMQLALIRNGTVRNEVDLGKEGRSVDYIVELSGVTLLIEVKATRLSEEARAGLPQLDADRDRTITKAQDQINRTERLWREGHPALQFIATDRPVRGLVVTLEPYWLAMSGFGGAKLSGPVMSNTASIRELELFCATAQVRDMSEAVLAMPKEHSNNVLHAACGDDRTRNPILDRNFVNLLSASP